MTWDWTVIKLKNKTNLYHRDRIDAIKKTIQTRLSEKCDRDIQNLYTLQGFFYLKWYETEDGRADLVEMSKQCFRDALEECREENTGYKYIIYGNLYLYSKALNDKTSQKKYHKFCLEMKKEEMSDQFKYENCEMKGFTASHFHLNEESTEFNNEALQYKNCLLYTSPSPRDGLLSRMPSSA